MRTIALVLFLTTPLMASTGNARPSQLDEKTVRQAFRPAGVRSEIAIRGFELDSPSPARYYVLGKEDAKLSHMVVFVPGSGCDGAFAMGRDGRARAGAEVFALKYVDRVRLVVLEAPGIPRQFAAPEHGLSEGCPRGFLARSDFDSLLASYKVAVDDALAMEGSNVEAVMFVGISDGAVTATALARQYRKTTHVTLISGFGSDQVTGQMEDLVGSVLDAPNDSDSHKALAAYAGRLNAIKAKPSGTALWQGQPETHWASTVNRASSAETIRLPERVKTLLVQGGSDTTWPATNFRRGVAELMVKGRSTWIQYIPCANHQLVCPEDGEAPTNLALVIDDAVHWFVDGTTPVTWKRLPKS